MVQESLVVCVVGALAILLASPVANVMDGLKPPVTLVFIDDTK